MRKQAQGILVATAALLACPFGGALAAEAPRPALRLDEAPFAPLMDQGVAAAKAGKPADALNDSPSVGPPHKRPQSRAPRANLRRRANSA
jgi:hypothetical protein